MYGEAFGTDGKGREARLIALQNANGTQVKISSLGATVVSFLFRDKTGVMRDIVLGYDSAEAYLENREYHFGATVGRCANRIANAKITINGTEYQLEANSGGNNLHSGSNGVSHRIWEIARVEENSVTFQFFSADLEQGFPGNMDMKVTFTLTEEDALHIAYEAVSDQDTIANFTNHSYFNLAGHDSGYIGKQKLKIYADAFTPLRAEDSVPTGEIRPVEGTPLDFREWRAFEDGIDSEYEQIRCMRGFDHNYALDDSDGLKRMAEAICEETGIHLYAYTDCPGMQLYAANYVREHRGKGGALYGERHAFCLEAQYFPDACHKPAFKTPLLKAGDIYRSETIYRLELE